MVEHRPSGSPPESRPADDGLEVLYVAFGPAYLAMAMASALSLRLSNPDVPYTIVTNVRMDPPATPWFGAADRWVHVDLPDEQNRQVKTRIDTYARTTRSLYLDCDTLVVGDLGLLDFELRHFDVLAFPEVRRTEGTHGAPALLDSGWRLRDTVVCNGGVIGFRRSAGSEDLFERWHRTFLELGLPIDQPALTHALHTTSGRYFPLGLRFNTTASTGRAGESVTILHYKRRGDRATRALVTKVADLILDPTILPRRSLREALAPSGSKRRTWTYLRARNADLVRRSVAADVRDAARTAGWL